MPTQIETLQAFVDDPLRTIVAHLATNPIRSMSDNFILANLTEANFPGYAPVTIRHWTPDPTSEDDLAAQVADACEFTAEAIGTPQTVTMLYLSMIYDGGAPVLMAAFPLDPVLSFEQAGQRLSRSPRITSMEEVDI